MDFVRIDPVMTGTQGRVYKKQVEPFQHKIANVKSTPP
jgi:hypothetical protein